MAVGDGNDRHQQQPWWLDALLWTVMVSYVLLCPFTKVEESFNAQATHDMLFVLGTNGSSNIMDFDHHTFPGVVPRTFIGSIALAAVARPVLEITRLVGPFLQALDLGDRLESLEVPVPQPFLNNDNKSISDAVPWLICIRICLGTFTVLALRKFRLALVEAYTANSSTDGRSSDNTNNKNNKKNKKNKKNDSNNNNPAATTQACQPHLVGIAFGLLSLTQFHVLFWGSRTLPNTFALIIVLHGLSKWLQGRYAMCIVLLVMSGVIFRSEIVLLLAPIVLEQLVKRRIQFFPTVHVGVASALFFAGLSIAVDSYFWQRWLWPEFEGLLFNVVENKSHLWGVMPWHWYFTQALPRSLLLSLPLVFVGLWADRQLFALLRPALFFVAAYSFLPHKETRFIFYALPLFTAIAAVGLGYIHQNRARSILHRLVWLGVALGFCIAIAICGVFLLAAMHNYPGGAALQKLQSLQATRIHTNANTTVHIDVAAAMTGVTRFGELKSPAWHYSKEENLKRDALLAKGFDFHLTEELQPLSPDFRIIAQITSFAGFELRWPPRIKLAPSITIQERIPKE